MFSQFHCCSFTSETTWWGFQQGGTWPNLQIGAHKSLERGLMSECTRRSFRLPSVKARQRPAPSFLAASCHQGGVPGHSTGPPSAWTRNSYPPQSITGALELRLREGERKHVLITIIKSDTCSVGRPRSCSYCPSSFLFPCCVFWIAYPGVWCVSVHGIAMPLLHPGTGSNSMTHSPPPTRPTLAHLRSQQWSESLAWTIVLSESWLLEKGPSKL